MIENKFKLLRYGIGIFALSIVTMLTYPCTGVRIIAQNGAVVYGRTLEFGKDIESNIIMIPRKYALVGTAPSGKKEGLQWKSKYAVVGANAFDVVAIIDGVNEEGLAGGLFYFSDYAGYQEVSSQEYSKSIAPWELMTWILTNFSTVAQVKEALPTIKVNNSFLEQLGTVPPLHAVVHDAAGNSLVIEYVGGKLFLYDNKIGVITNSPTFAWHTTNLKNYIRLSARNIAHLQLQNLNLKPLGQGSGMLGLPGDFTSTSRFVRAVAFSQSVVPAKNEIEARNTVFHILNLFDIPRGIVYEQDHGHTVYDYTQWTSVSDLHNQQYYFTSYNNPQPHMVALKAMNLNGQHVVMIPMSSNQTIVDVTSQSSTVANEPESIFEAAVQSYIYAYPLVVMEVTKNIMTSKKRVSKQRAAINEFAHVAEFPTDTFTDIVRPNVDTLYSFAWLDLSDGPVILSVPDTHGRYYLMEIMDAWTNVFASIGKRTTGTKAQDFALVGPFCKGDLPKNMKVIRAPTSMVLILGRTQTNGKRDYDTVHKIQRGYTVTPAHAEKKSLRCNNGFDQKVGQMQKAPVDYVADLDAQQFFTIFTQAVGINPHAKQDDAALVNLKKIGIEVGKPFAGDTWSPQMQETINQAMKKAKKRIANESKDFGKIVNGWNILFDIGTYGTDYLTRAVVAFIGIGANLPKDAVYPTAFVDSDGDPLSGDHTYVIHFDKNDLPPAHAFWSLTVYNAQSFLVPNKIERFALGDRDIMRYNKDGSLDIYIQHASPGKNKEDNWLPAPEGSFNVTMRMYWPKPEVLDGTWNPPGIKRID